MLPRAWYPAHADGPPAAGRTENDAVAAQRSVGISAAMLVYPIWLVDNCLGHTSAWLMGHATTAANREASSPHSHHLNFF